MCAAALGVMWNRCVRSLYLSLFKESYGALVSNFSSEQLDKDLPMLLASAFMALQRSTLEEIEAGVDGLGLAKLLDKEMPETVAGQVFELRVRVAIKNSYTLIFE